MTDAVVVGSGPNGLTAAVILARHGVDVTVLERASTIGGGTRSAELTVPGLIHDECAGFHPLAVDNPFTRTVDLSAHGLEWGWPEVQYSSPLDESGRGAAAVRSVVETAADLGSDRTRWLRVFQPLDRSFPEVSEDILGPLLHWPHHRLGLARFGLRASLPARALGRYFDTEEAASLWAGVAAHACRPFGSPLSSAIGVALGTAAHTYGWPVALGGSQRIADALASALLDNGGRIETGVSVSSLDELSDRDVVMLDTSPATALEISAAALPWRIARAYRRYRYGPGAFKVDFAVDGGIPWRHEPSRRAGTVHVGGSLEEIADAEAAVQRGEMPDRPYVLVGQQAVADPVRAVGSVVPVYSYAHTPHGFPGDATEAITDQIERFAPGFRDRIVGRHVRSTTAMSIHNLNYVGGDILTGANDPLQLIFRPRLSLRPYDTGIEGVYLCSAATPPGPGAHGMCGFRAAHAALAALDSGGAVRADRRS